MTIILFLVDTSASMNQRTYLGARQTLLDVAKDAVEKFIKIRQRDSASRGDRYMLLTFEEAPAHIKAGWKENHVTFMTELKNLRALGMSTLGPALKNSLDLLNINRMQTGIDTYGQGRSPFYLEPSIIVLITDGGKLSSTHGTQEELNLPMHSTLPGSELTKEPFRWDQRLFALVLRLTGTPQVERDVNSVVPSDSSPIDAMCDVTGGRSYAVTSQRTLIQCLESLVQKVQGGVVISFEKVGPDPPLLPSEVADAVPQEDKGPPAVQVANHRTGPNNSTLPNNNGGGVGAVPGSPGTPAWHSCRKLIYVPRSAQKGYSVGYWPIPEAFWPDLGPTLPPRLAHPVVKFMCNNSEPLVIDNLPFDKYELEPSPLTQYILSRKQPTVVWQVFISGSSRNNDLGLPFGYLKASTSLTCVNLFVMPYNYPTLLPLLDDLLKVHRCKPTREWKTQFDAYLKNMPLYYSAPLKRALQRMQAPNLIPENLENCLSYSVLNYLKRMKNQAKTEFDKLVLSVGTGKSLSPEGIRVSSSNLRPTCKLSEMSLTSNPALIDRFADLRSEVNDFSGFMLSVRNKEVNVESYRNPFDIPRRHLLDHIARLRANYLQQTVSQTRLQDEDQRHSLLVGQMGNYQEYLKRMPTPLRELESTPVRQHMFGNPFKTEKRMMVDEADIDLVGSGGSSPSHGARGIKRPSLPEMPPGAGRGAGKRRPGPLPKDFRRPQSPLPLLSSPPASPGLPTAAMAATTERERAPTLDSAVADEAQGNAALPPIGSQSIAENEQRGPPSLLDGMGNDWSGSGGNDNHRVSNHVEEWSSPSSRPQSQAGKEGEGSSLLLCVQTRGDHLQLRKALFKEVRRPGRNFEKLLDQLRSVQDNVETQSFLIKQVIQEAGRFKRKSLVAILEDFHQKLLRPERNANI